MELNKLVFGGLVVGCLAAAGGGAYLATRQNAQAATVAPAPVATPTPEAAVTASEGVVAPETPAASTPSTPERPRSAAPATPAPRATPRPAVAPRVTDRRAPTSAPASPASTSASLPMPSPTAAPSTTGGSMWEARPSVEPEVAAAADPEPDPEPAPAPPPAPEFVELVVPADAVIGLQLETAVSSDTAKIEDVVDARVTRDVRVAGRVAIPAGSLVHGTVTEVERGGKVRERARLGIRFHTVVLAGERLTLRTDAITREGAAPGRESAAKIGGAAAGGAILGAILGGRKGAAIGGAVGGGAGTAAVLAGERNSVTLPAGSTVSVRVQQPVSVTVEKE